MNSNPPSTDTNAQVSDLDISLVKRIELKPAEQQSIPLGSFRGDNPPKGYSVELTPDPDPENSISTEVVSLGTPNQYKLVLHIANYGVSSVTAAVRQL